MKMKTKGELVISPDLFDLMLLQVLTLRAQMACSPFPSALFGSGTECFFKTSSMLHRSAERFMTHRHWMRVGYALFCLPGDSSELQRIPMCFSINFVEANSTDVYTPWKSHALCKHILLFNLFCFLFLDPDLCSDLLRFIFRAG